MRNWATWCRNRPHYGHCASIEFRYRSPQTWYPPEPRIEVDSLSALAIERIMRYVPALHREALKLRYVVRLPRRDICRALHVPYDLWWQFVGDAQQMVANLLTRTHHGYSVRPLTDSPPALLAPHGAGCIAETA